MLRTMAPLLGRRLRQLICAAIAVFFIQSIPTYAETEPNPKKLSPLDNAFVVLEKLELGQNLGILNPIELAVLRSHDNLAVRKDLEQRLLSTLKSKATDLAKEYACRQLAIVGSDDSLDTLAGLLTNPRLSTMSRCALEGINSPDARKTLRKAIPETEGPQKAGVVISLGRMADAEATSLIVPLLADKQTAVVEASVIALGRLGTPEAFDALHQFRSKTSGGLKAMVINAELETAEQLLKRGKQAEAVRCYKTLADDDSTTVSQMAFRGLILSQPAKAVSLIVAALADQNESKRTVAADCILSLNKPNDVKRIAEAITGLPMEGKVAALYALRGGKDPSVRDAALKALGDSNERVRINALRALIAAGTGKDVARLATLAENDPNTDVQSAARETLRLMRHPDTNAAIIGILSDAGTPSVCLLQAAFARRSPEFVPVFLAAAKSSEASLRKLAFEALEVMADVEHTDTLVALLAKSNDGEEREAAGRAVWMTCEKIPDPKKRAEPLFRGYEKADTAGRAAILPSIARIGGEKALGIVHTAMESPEKGLRDAGYRALANWPDAAVADDLLAIAKTSKNDAYRIWSLRAYARVVSLPNAFPAEKAFGMLKSAMELATRTEDRKLIISRLAAVRTPDSLKLLLSYLDDDGLKSDAVNAVFLSAKGLSQSHPDLAEPALRKIRELTEDQSILQQTRKVLRDIEARQAKASK